MLGNGERQRLCLARVLIQRPDIVVLDDALAALDEAAQESLEAMIAARLPKATLISLGQRPRAAGGGTQRYEFDADRRVGDGAGRRCSPHSPEAVGHDRIVQK